MQPGAWVRWKALVPAMAAKQPAPSAEGWRIADRSSVALMAASAGAASRASAVAVVRMVFMDLSLAVVGKENLHIVNFIVNAEIYIA
ncbi:hypothetical protein C8N38_11371 [Rhodovulum kholense]|uniref:Uncharacterized protein n=1 Tax=Rhodovulum kholense TaxID=453584 RepID=A0A8E2VHF4_9RHOB|nr:hypothetical protein C8N38_11371 [Rhodovulum kholense]